MLSLDLARRLRDAGLKWSPASGDRFVVADRGMDGEVFVLSEMTIDVHDLPQGRVIGFNGTVEWALDSVEQDDTLWLPRETQLRDLLGSSFRTFTRTERSWQVRIDVNGHPQTCEHADAEQAYGLALLRLLEELR